MKTTLLPLALLLATLPPVFATPPDPGFTAHEWGTFTSVQGADGAQMDWNPLVVSELPEFVYERNHVLAKGRIAASTPFLAFKIAAPMCTQRMETPVIYFYSDKARTVDVSVNFPSGTISEWYPQQSAADLGMRTAAHAEATAALHWPKVEILPKQEETNVTLPTGPGGSHYYAARETDAAVLRTIDEAGKAEVEKFLFYRGIGGFIAPLTVKIAKADSSVGLVGNGLNKAVMMDVPGVPQVTLTNTGKESLRHLFLCDVRANSIAWVASNDLAPGETRLLTVAGVGDPKVAWDDRDKRGPEGTDTASLTAALRTALVSEGLYEKEAAAMVKNWETSWLGERGMRVLYTLPRKWTDATLPLAIAPAPQAIERVMVGRAEIITPAMEKAVLDVAQRYLDGPAALRPQAIADARALSMGRFFEPAMRRVLMAEKRPPAFSAYSLELMEKVAEPVKNPVTTTSAATTTPATKE